MGQHLAEAVSRWQGFHIVTHVPIAWSLGEVSLGTE